MQRKQEKQMCLAIVLMIFMYWIGVAESRAAAVERIIPRTSGHTDLAAAAQPSPSAACAMIPKTQIDHFLALNLACDERIEVAITEARATKGMAGGWATIDGKAYRLRSQPAPEDPISLTHYGWRAEHNAADILYVYLAKAKVEAAPMPGSSYVLRVSPHPLESPFRPHDSYECTTWTAPVR